VQGFDNAFRLRPVGMELNLLIQIARCARLARFVRSRTVINASNQINWYWFFKHVKFCNPLFYYKRIRNNRRQARLESLGTVDESTSFVQTSRGGDKRTSWGVLQIGILAAVRAQAEAEAREARAARKAGFWDTLKRPFGFMRKQEVYPQIRQVAAIKIQRAWRQHVRFEAAMSTDGGSMLGDLALDDDSNSFMNSHRSHYVNPLDRVQGNKRSVLSAFGQMNIHAGGKLDAHEIKASFGTNRNEQSGSRFQSQAGRGRESQVGSDMRELTGQRVAIGVLLALVFTVVFTYTESSSTWPTTMVVLHNQTMNDQYRMDALSVARNTTASKMYLYEPAMDDIIVFPVEGAKELRPRERIRYVVTDASGQETAAEFAFRDEIVQEALTDIVATLFVLVVWFFGVTAFAGPVMSLVVVPIERMVRLLGMLMMDPLGYQSTQKFKNFLIEEEKLINNTGWTRDVLKGMETSFLMSTILRIGSLMKVGFGSAGVEIIRNSLQKGQSKNMLILTTQGSTVACIFLFCDIRQFTDATECLQEEVFVFTNRIAAVIHSICHSYGGAANKNVGDAFLLSWSLEDNEGNKNNSYSARTREDGVLKATSNQADKALLSVIKICISLYYDNYYLEPLSETARNKLKDKIKKRTGPVVQMGFGLHAGKAVQGAIGSQRKIDATYVSEAVERAEFLESSTKKYGLELLMSGSFHRLLHPNTRRRCRKIDRVLLQDSDEDADEDDDELHGELMELFTFDMDVAAIHRPQIKTRGVENETISDSGSIIIEGGRKVRKIIERRSQIRNRRRSISLRLQPALNGSEEFNLSGPGGTENSQRGAQSLLGVGTVVSSSNSVEESPSLYQGLPELVLPTGPALYSHNVWQSPDMKRVRDKFVQGLFFQKFQAGLQAYYNKDWDMARQCFLTVLENFDDGPSKHFMNEMKKNKGVPPKDFLEYSLA
jgi:class 3 adenylate cyclase